MNKLYNIIILSGGFSEEADVSKTTSREISKTLNENEKDIIILDPAERYYNIRSGRIFILLQIDNEDKRAKARHCL